FTTAAVTNVGSLVIWNYYFSFFIIKDHDELTICILEGHIIISEIVFCNLCDIRNIQAMKYFVIVDFFFDVHWQFLYRDLLGQMVCPSTIRQGTTVLGRDFRMVAVTSNS